MYSFEKYKLLKQYPTFYTDVYKYYVRGGYRCILIHNILSIISSAFIMLFYIFIAFCIKWSNVVKCTTENECDKISDFITSPSTYHSTTLNVFIILFVIVFLIYWLWTVLSSTIDILNSIKYNYYFSIALQVDINNIIVFTWNDIINKMIKYDNSLNHHIIISNIMKYDNYMVALVNQDILNVRKTYYSNYFEWMIRFCIINRLFNGSTLDMIFIKDVKLIKRNMKILGIITLVLSPFIFIITGVYYIVKCTADFYTKKTYFGPKDWSNYAKWKFREFNELEHIFNKRMFLSHKYAYEYESRFTSNLIQIFVNFITLILGTLITVLLFITFFDERIMLYLKIYDRNLLWYIAVLTGIIAVCRMLLTDDKHKEKTHEELLDNVVKYTHYYSESWKTVNNNIIILNEFHQLYNYTLASIFRELLGIFIAPLLMIYKINKRVPVILSFIENSTSYNEKIGHICKYSDFELSRNGHTYYNVDVNESVLVDDDPSDERILTSSCKNNKLKQSILNFNNNYGISPNVDIQLEELAEQGSVSTDGFSNCEEMQRINDLFKENKEIV